MTELQHTLSRRGFAQFLGASAAFAALRPVASATGLGVQRVARADASSSLIRLSANENPYGPSPAALRAMTDAFDIACRYPENHGSIVRSDVAKINGVSGDSVTLGNGSGEILKICASQFTGRGRKLIVADPTFEDLGRHARQMGAEVVQVPLTSDYRHDLQKMLAASKDAGLVYICNPNNPTATITPKGEVRDFLANLPASVKVLVDEAYFHYAESSDYETVIPLIAKYPNLIVARTFSKIFGMAGLRCGYCVAQPEVIRSLQQHQTFANVNVMALVAAHASLQDQKYVDQGKALNTETRKYVTSELDRLGYHYTPSQANFLMIDMRREVRPLLQAMHGYGVEVGRLFPAMPNYMRVTIGKKEEMQSFVSAFAKVVA